MTKRMVNPKLNIPDVQIRYLSLPCSVEGVTIPNHDGSFDIYINDVFCDEKKREILLHELAHLQKDHFYLDISIGILEKEADRLINIF